MTVPLSLRVNGKAVSAAVEPDTLLVTFIREHLRLTGTHVGCDTGQRGPIMVASPIVALFMKGPMPCLSR